MYYYNLKNGNQLWYSTDGFYEHAELTDEEKKNHVYMHTKPEQGGVWYEQVNKEIVELEKGDKLQTVKTLIKKVTQGRKDLKCKYCDKFFIWKGYRVQLIKVLKKGKNFGIAGFNLTMGSEEKVLFTRWFNKKSQELKFVRKYIADQ